MKLSLPWRIHSPLLVGGVVGMLRLRFLTQFPRRDLKAHRATTHKESSRTEMSTRPTPSWGTTAAVAKPAGGPLSRDRKRMRSVGTSARWEHTHQCRKCGHVIRIDDIDPKVITTGVVTCPKCEMSGPVNVKILQIKR